MTDNSLDPALPEKNVPAPLVSIITVCLNVREDIEATIQSVLSQTYERIEYIIIDGVSTDGTLEVIEQYRDRLGRFISEKDKGISDAFNKGIGLAQGEIVGILNAGDVYHSETVAATVKRLSNERYGFSYGDCVFIEPSGRRFKLQGDVRYQESIEYRMPALNHPTVFVKKWVYEKHGGFYDNWRLAMDYELLLRFHKASVRGVYIPGTLAYMPRDGVSQRRHIGALREQREISIEYGFSPIRAKLYYALYLFRFYVRKLLEKAGLLSLLGLIRRVINRDYREA